MKTAGKLDLGHHTQHWNDLDTEFFVLKLSRIEQAFADSMDNEILHPEGGPCTDVVITPTEVKLIAGFFSTEEQAYEIIWTHKEFLLANCWSRDERDSFVASLEKLLKKAKALEYNDRGEEIKGIGTKAPSVLD